MEKKNETVQKLDNQYVGENCVQVMIPFKDTITLLNQDGIIFHSKEGSSVYINKYLDDERKEKFPYSNIPTHYEQVGLKKYSYANQLLDFEKTYISVGDGKVSEFFAIKDNEQALLVNKDLHGDKTTMHMTYDELLKFIKKNNSNEQVYYVCLDGSMPLSGRSIYPSKEEIYNHIQNLLMQDVENIKTYQQAYPGYRVSDLKISPRFLKYIEESIKNLDLSLIDYNLGIGNDSTLLVIRVNNGNITIQGVDAVFVRDDDFKIDVYDIPVTKYVLEQVRHASKIKSYQEPKIPLRLNPSVTKQDIEEVKKMIKTLKR